MSLKAESVSPDWFKHKRADKNLIVSPNDPHPSAEGHQQWTTQLIEFIDANNLRTI